MSRQEECECGEHYYDPDYYSSCFECFLERRSDYLSCILCGRWHSPAYDTCYRCRRTDSDRVEAARSLRQYILWRDDMRCRSCGETGLLHVDHIIPCAKGGDASPWNLQALCRRCNLDKADMWIPGGRWDRFRRELIGYYFLAGRGWLDDDQRRRLDVEVAAIRADSLAHRLAARRAREMP